MTLAPQSCRCCGVVDGRDYLGGVITTPRNQRLSDEDIARLGAALRAPTANVIVLPAGATWQPVAVLTIYWVEPDLCAFCAMSTRAFYPASTHGAHA